MSHTGFYFIRSVAYLAGLLLFFSSTAHADLLTLNAAQQSSTGWSGTAGRAIDGNTSGAWIDKSTTHTAIGDSQAWWGASLASSSNITNIELWNRTDNCCSERLSYFYVFVSDTPFTSTDINETLNNSAVWSHYHGGAVGEFLEIPVNVLGRYIRVQLAGTGFLSLAEVVVNGESGSTNDTPITAQYEGVSDEMWNEIEATRTDFNDVNNCRAKVNDIPTVGYQLAPCDGDCINQALDVHSVVQLLPGRYRISETIGVWGSKLIGAHPTDVIIDASDVDVAISVAGYYVDLLGGVVANLSVENARNIGVELANDSTLHKVLVNGTGSSSYSNLVGAGVFTYGGEDNCIVSVASNHGYNEDTGNCQTCTAGGNADGFQIANGAGRNTLIDSHASRNSDDGFDFWFAESSNFIYFSSAFDNGKPTDGRPAGDGNGFKLGQGNAPHYLYKSTAYNNVRAGFDRNGNTVSPLARSSQAYDNGIGLDWVGDFIRED